MKKSGFCFLLPIATSSLLCPLASPRSQGTFCCFHQPHPVSVCCIFWPHQGVRAYFVASTSLIQPQIAVSLGLTKESGLILPLPAVSSCLSLLCPLASPRSQGSFCRFQQPHPALNCCVSWPHQGVRAHFAASSSLVLSQFAVSIGLTKESGLILPLPAASSSHKLLCLLASPRSQGSFCRFQQSRPVSVCCVHWPHQGVRAHFAASSSLIQPQIAVSLGLTKESGLILLLPPASSSHKLLCPSVSPKSKDCFHWPH